MDADYVLLSQSGAQLSNVSINCAESTNLFVNGLDILNTEDKSAIKFTDGKNTLNLMGTNTFLQNGTDVALAGGLDPSLYSALIQIDSHADLEIKNAAGNSGILNATIEPSWSGSGVSRTDIFGAVIGAGGNSLIDGGNLTISSGEISAKITGDYDPLCSVIGSGMNTFGNITITGGTVKAEHDNSSWGQGGGGSAIGGYVGNITISGGDVYAMSSVPATNGAAIGGNHYNSITISGGSVKAEIERGMGAAIGGVNTGSGITFSGGEIWATVNDDSSFGAAIGGSGMYGAVGMPEDGSNLTISGAILHITGSHIGAGRHLSDPSYIGDPGTVTFTNKDDINALFDYIQPPIFEEESVILDENGTPLYRTKVDGATFPPNSYIDYTIDGEEYTSQVHSDGTFYLYLPLSDNGKSIEFSAGGMTFSGTVDSTNTHDNVLSLTQTGSPSSDPETGDLWIQSGANQNEGIWLSTYDCRATTLGVSKLFTDPRDKAEQSLDDISKAINTVSMYRADAGAKQNRMEHSLRNVENTAENLAAAESRIRDVDMAKEMTEYVKQDILTQSATAILAQANQAPQGVLQLLG